MTWVQTPASQLISSVDHFICHLISPSLTLKFWKVRWNSVKPLKFSFHSKILQLFETFFETFSNVSKLVRGRSCSDWINTCYGVRRSLDTGFIRDISSWLDPWVQLKYIKHVSYVLNLLWKRASRQKIYSFLISLVQNVGSKILYPK